MNVLTVNGELDLEGGVWVSEVGGRHGSRKGFRRGAVEAGKQGGGYEECGGDRWGRRRRTYKGRGEGRGEGEGTGTGTDVSEDTVHMRCRGKQMAREMCHGEG